MNFFRRAFLSTIRKKGKSFILLIVIFILGNLMAGSIAVQQATMNTESTIKEKLGAEARVELDWENPIFSEEEAKIPQLKNDIIEKIGKLNGVKYYEYNSEGMLNSKKYETYCGPDCTTSGGQVEGEFFNLYGVQIPSLLDISENKVKLADGRAFSKEEVDQGENVALVSTKFAEMNNVHVGESISLDANIFKMEEMDDNGNPVIAKTEGFTFEVIGLFDASPSMKENLEGSASSDGFVDYSLTQRIYVPNKVISSINAWRMQQEKEINGIDEESAAYDELRLPKYYLKDAKILSEFKAEATALLPDGLLMIVSSDAYDSIAGPISFISWLSTGILYLSIAATVLILGLVVILFLRDRRHEFGIYLSIGVKKWKIVAQVVLEVLVVGMIAITLSLFSGKALASNISKTMIDKQVMDNNAYGMIGGGMAGEPYVDPSEVVEAYEVTLDGDYVLMLYIVGIGTLLVASIAPTAYVVRLKPKKILM